MSKVKVPKWNSEIVKSLIYWLERTYSGVEFVADEKSQSVLTKQKSQGQIPSQDVLSNAVKDFLRSSERMAGRVKPQIIDSFLSERNATQSAKTGMTADVKNTALAGVYWLGPCSRELFSLLDEVFLGFALAYDAKVVHPPALISQSDLEKCGYLQKELHQVSFICSMNTLNGTLKNERTCLSPAACLTTYPMLHGSVLENQTVLTLLGSVFRREGGRFSSKRPLERMWEYQVREIIFFGDTAFQSKVQLDYFQFLGAIGRKLDISFEISSAADLFFHAEHSVLAIHQLINRSKFEFNFLSSNAPLALSSFNSHGNQFTLPFDIKGKISDFQSFCIGFGLQRWIQAILSTYEDLSVPKKILKEMIDDSKPRRFQKVT